MTKGRKWWNTATFLTEMQIGVATWLRPIIHHITFICTVKNQMVKCSMLVKDTEIEQMTNTKEANGGNK